MHLPSMLAVLGLAAGLAAPPAHAQQAAPRDAVPLTTLAAPAVEADRPAQPAQPPRSRSVFGAAMAELTRSMRTAPQTPHRSDDAPVARPAAAGQPHVVVDSVAHAPDSDGG